MRFQALAIVFVVLLGFAPCASPYGNQSPAKPGSKEQMAQAVSAISAGKQLLEQDGRWFQSTLPPSASNPAAVDAYIQGRTLYQEAQISYNRWVEYLAFCARYKCKSNYDPSAAEAAEKKTEEFQQCARGVYRAVKDGSLKLIDAPEIRIGDIVSQPSSVSVGAIVHAVFSVFSAILEMKQKNRNQFADEIERKYKVTSWDELMEKPQQMHKAAAKADKSKSR